MTDNLRWLGHASFRWDGMKTIYFDPWKLAKNSKKADIILVTHEHFDHFSKEDIALIVSKDTVILTDKTVAKQLKGAINCKDIQALSVGDEIEVDEIGIKAVASYNTNKDFHTKSSQKLGFIVSMGGVSLYHAGDTDFIPEMKGYRCDIALLPVSGTYVMTAQEAVQAALAIMPKVAIPMHYGDIVGSEDDANMFKKGLSGKVTVRVLNKE